MSEPQPVGELTYEQARDELVAVVRQLEAGGISLEQSLALWERGEELADRCQEWLDGAKSRLDKARARSSDSESTDDSPADGHPTDEAAVEGSD